MASSEASITIRPITDILPRHENTGKFQRQFDNSVVTAPKRSRAASLSRFVRHEYPYFNPPANPFTTAPYASEEGGTIYFRNSVSRNDLNALLRVLDIKTSDREYALVRAIADNPGKQEFLEQIRVVSKFGLLCEFHDINEEKYDKFPKQKLSIGQVVWLFVQKERERWGTEFWHDKTTGLAGKFGGNGDGMREKLSFGLTMESSYYGIFRLWSRAWLVGK